MSLKTLGTRDLIHGKSFSMWPHQSFRTLTTPSLSLAGGRKRTGAAHEHGMTDSVCRDVRTALPEEPPNNWDFRFPRLSKSGFRNAGQAFAAAFRLAHADNSYDLSGRVSGKIEDLPNARISGLHCPLSHSRSSNSWNSMASCS